MMKKCLSLLIALLTVQQLYAIPTFQGAKRDLLLVNQRLTKAQKATLHATIWATHFATNDLPKTDAALCTTLLNLGTQIPLIIPQPYFTQGCPICIEDHPTTPRINLTCCGKIICTECLTSEYTRLLVAEKSLNCPFCKQKMLTGLDKASCNVRKRTLKRIGTGPLFRAKLAEARHSAAQAIEQQIADDAQAALQAEQQEAAELFGGNEDAALDNLPPGVHFDEDGNLAADPGNDTAFAFVLQQQELALLEALQQQNQQDVDQNGE